MAQTWHIIDLEYRERDGMKLFYGSFDETLYKYFDYYECREKTDRDGVGNIGKKKIPAKDFTPLLLASGVGGVDALAEIWPNIYDEAEITKRRSGDKPVPEAVKGTFIDRSQKKKHAEVEQYFAGFISPYVLEERRADCIRDLSNLIREDDSIAEDEKDALLQIDTSSESGFNTFLCNVFLYAVHQPVPDVACIENLPFQKNRFFTGRDALLRKIRDYFRKGGGILCISGIAGCGKTQAALAYAYTYSVNYNYICWINASSEHEMVSSIKEFLNSAGVTVHEKTDHYAYVREFISWTSAHSQWLIIYDNVEYGHREQTYNLQKFLPKRTENGHTIFTSRNDEPYPGSSIARINVFDEQAGRAFITKRLNKRKTPADADALVKRLGGLPLALEEACAFLQAVPGSTIRDYIRLLDEHQFGFADDMVATASHLLTMHQVTALTISKIESEQAKLFLAMLSYFSETGLDTQLFNLLRAFSSPSSESLFPAPLREALCDEIEFYKLMKELRIYSLCKPIYAKDPTEYTYSYYTRIKNISSHKLTREIVRSEFDPDGKAARIALDMCHNAIKNCSVLNGDYYPIVSDITAFLKNSSELFGDSRGKEECGKLAELFRYATWALPDNDARQPWLWENYQRYTVRAYGPASAQAAYAKLEYFENHQETETLKSLKCLNEAMLLIVDMPESEKMFSHQHYTKNDGFPGLILKIENYTHNGLKLLFYALSGLSLVCGIEDRKFARHFTSKQRDVIHDLFREFFNELQEDEENKREYGTNLTYEDAIEAIDQAISELIS